MRKKSVLFGLLSCGVIAQLAFLVGRTGPDPADARPLPLLVGDSLVDLLGRADGSVEDSIQLRGVPGEATVVFAFHSECAFCDDVAPEWASYFGTPPVDGVRRIAISREPPDAAVDYVRRKGWKVRWLSMANVLETDRRSYLLSRTPWIYVFDHRGVLAFHGHGSEIDRAGQVASEVARLAKRSVDADEYPER